ncbi:unnamed protein product, partial [Brassica oleracea var. botrytis]
YNSFVKVVDPQGTRHSFERVIKWIILSIVYEKGEDFSAFTPGKCSSFYAVLLSYVAVCTGSEDASETTLVYLVGEN